MTNRLITGDSEGKRKRGMRKAKIKHEKTGDKHKRVFQSVIVSCKHEIESRTMQKKRLCQRIEKWQDKRVQFISAIIINQTRNTHKVKFARGLQ